MRTIIALIISLVLSSSAYGQNKISYSFSIESENGSEDATLFSGEIFEGGSILFQDTISSILNPNQRFFCNLFSNSEIIFPDNSLEEDISINLRITDINKLNIDNISSDDNILKILCLQISVEGENSGSHINGTKYYLQNGKEILIKIPLTNLSSIFEHFSCSDDYFCSYFVENDNNLSELQGIKYDLTDRYLTLHLENLSSIALGLDLTTDVNSEIKILNPDNYTLSQNYPNPFNPSTKIEYSITSQAHINLTIYNIMGEKISTLVNEIQPQGNYQVKFNARNLASGIYYYTLSNNEFSETKSMILTK